MSKLLYVAYFTMAIWMLVASGRRIALFLLAGQTLDWSPFVSGAIAALALLIAVLILSETKKL